MAALIATAPRFTLPEVALLRLSYRHHSCYGRASPATRAIGPISLDWRHQVGLLASSAADSSAPARGRWATGTARTGRRRDLGGLQPVSSFRNVGQGDNGLDPETTDTDGSPQVDEGASPVSAIAVCDIAVRGAGAGVGVSVLMGQVAVCAEEASVHMLWPIQGSLVAMSITVDGLAARIHMR